MRRSFLRESDDIPVIRDQVGAFGNDIGVSEDLMRKAACFLNSLECGLGNREIGQVPLQGRMFNCIDLRNQKVNVCLLDTVMEQSCPGSVSGDKGFEEMLVELASHGE
ncbi:MAG: hypothetical protein HUU16_15040 [Candidatus Omnitrophica bacterium]|nr:hypothetical protein [Candidatus Omnitrophota bacterium]